ncbi:MAG: PAS domain-containing protein, partial [Deltaproteobacteria bacterium]|nr:PAS domain-containing protein [Deltaproteobacteria bacterium]
MTTSPEAIALKAVDLISGMLAYWDRAERCVFANAAYAVWFGRDPAAMRGITMAEFLGPLYAVTLPFIERAFAGEPQQFERILTIPDGRVRHVLAEYTPDIVEGTVVGIIAHVTDVTTLREREAVLHRTTTLLDRVGAMAHVGGAEIDLRTGEVFWTAEMCRILDVDPAHVPPPARWDEFFEGDALTRYRAAVDEMRTRGVPLDLETPMITATGRRIWVRIVSTAVKDGDTVVKLISAHQDVTARKAADAALHASEAFAVDVLDSMDDYLAVIDERGAILSVNAAWRRFAPTCAWSPID